MGSGTTPWNGGAGSNGGGGAGGGTGNLGTIAAGGIGGVAMLSVGASGFAGAAKGLKNLISDFKFSRYDVSANPFGTELSKGASIPKIDPRRNIINDIPGRVQSRINIRAGSQAEGAGWKHAVFEHFSGKPNKSQFTVSQEEFRTILQSKEVVNSPVSRILESANGPRYVRDIDLGKVIGIDKFSGQATSRFTVLTDRYGNLVTASPGIIK